MEKQIFTNEVILSWLQYYAKNTTIDLEHVKIIDITKKNKNVIPTVESHKTTMVFTNAGIDDIFYRLWNAGLGECEVWYNDGSDKMEHPFQKFPWKNGFIKHLVSYRNLGSIAVDDGIRLNLIPVLPAVISIHISSGSKNNKMIFP